MKDTKVQYLHNLTEFKSYNEIKSRVLHPKFPWFYSPVSTSEKFPFLGNEIVDREGKILSEEGFKLCLELMKDITDKMKVDFVQPIRICVNMAQAGVSPITDWHVDHTDRDHKVLLVYFNQTKKGNTLVSTTKYDKDKPVLPAFKSYPDKNIKKGETIKPCEDTAVVFDGLRWHTAILPEPGTRRVTLVATFI
ncbi:MAG: hypothetical protein CMK29_05940 [Porticoccaceae bacterium]|nr:hypothetical protein [Porticoccaceae bacterium]OUW58416.1 MAG: hypothetical protein CBD57_02560 [Candidatus Pelagibacter sp. TMED197]|tara:strand:+ start:5874 stop:6452 length:579 start_codon:yes stop_codon:yes gene_type:complete